MRSLKGAIVGRILMALGGLVLVLAVAAYYAARYEADEFMDDYLQQFAEAADPSVQVNPEGGSFREPEDRFERIVWKSGTRMSSTSGAPRGIWQPSYVGFRNLNSDREGWRAYVIRKQSFVVMLLQRSSARAELAQHAAIEVSVAILATVLVSSVIIIFTVGRTMRRLNALGTTIAARSVRTRERFPTDAVPAEVQSLVVAVNVLTERLQAALDQQRRFIADSAHELRTPLTALRIQIDNLTQNPGVRQSIDAEELQAGILRASSVLNQLLRLARFDGSEALEEGGVSDLAEVLRHCAAGAVEIADDGKVDLGLAAAEPVRAKIARNDAVLLISNILDNAVRYTPPGGIVDCELVRSGSDALVRIKDTGPGVAPADVARLTERFFRAKGIDTIGSGLGLSIVKAIADAYGIGLSFENRSDPSGLAVTLLFTSAMLLNGGSMADALASAEDQELIPTSMALIPKSSPSPRG